MLQNIVDFKAKSFLTERNTSTIAYEVKGVRAIWDPSLSIPGTNRRGGWRCPVGTRYGGQITDRFGRSCGWGVARRIANQISDIGERLENVDDARRGRRIARRERRILARLNPQDRGAGRLERGLRGVADRLDGGETPTPAVGRRRTVVARTPSIDTPELPPAPRPQRRRQAPARPQRDEANLLAAEPIEVLEEMRDELENATGGRQSDDYKRVMAELRRRNAPVRPARRQQPARRRGGGNLRESEQRRMEREIEQPGAPRTGEAPARRRRRAVADATRAPRAPRRRQEEAVQPAPEPRVVTPRRPQPADDANLIKRPKRRKPAGSDNAARSEELRQARADRARGAGKEVDVDKILNNENSQEYVGYLRDTVLKEQRLVVINDSENFPNDRQQMREKFWYAKQRIRAANYRIDKLQQAINRGELGDNDYMEIGGERITVARMKTLIADHRDGWQEVADQLESMPLINPNNASPPTPARAPLGVPLLDNNAFDNFVRGWIPAIGKDLTEEERRVMREQWDAEEEAVDEVRRFFRRRIVDEELGGPDDLRERIASNLEEIRKAQSRIDGDVELIQDGAANGQRRADALNRIVVNAQERRRRVLENEFMEQAIRDARSDSPKTPKPKTPKPKTPTPKPDSIDAPFEAPTRRDIRNVPEELKHVPPKMEIAKFSAEDEQVIERVLLSIQDPERLVEFGLLGDQAIFNHNEGRQLALRRYQNELDRAIAKYKANPDGFNLANEVNAAKAAYMAHLAPYGSKSQAEDRLKALKESNKTLLRAIQLPAGNTPRDRDAARAQSMDKLGKNLSEIGKIEGHLQLNDSLEQEIRKAVERQKQGFVFNPDATDMPKPTPDDVLKQINKQIEAAIDRRQTKLEKYLKKRHPQGGAPYEDMTPEKWRTLTAAQRQDYLKQAYSHDRIEGANGKLYRAEATVRGSMNNHHVSVVFHEINKDGVIIRRGIASSSRDVSASQVSQNSMFVTSKIDRGADIQTIYNQHAFLYLKKIGVSKAKVNAADDGQYVWARVGFKRSRPLDRMELEKLEAPLRFYENFGAGGLIGNDAEYQRIKSILTQARGGKTFHHQDIIFALDDPTGDKARAEYVKQWFKDGRSGLPFPGGELSFAAQKVGARFAKPKTRRPRIRVQQPRA